MNVSSVTAAGTGRRGAGLGNEVLAWGKSILAAEALDARLLAPRWLRNRYQLGAQLGITRVELLRSEAESRLLPSVEVTERDYWDTGVTDFGEAVRILRDHGTLGRARVLVTSGMWGGYAAIAGARQALHDRLLDIPGARRLVDTAVSGAPMTVGLHVRRGDFAGPGPTSGMFNRPIPVGWFVGLVESLETQLPDARFVVCTDAAPHQLPELSGHPRVRVVRGEGVAAPVQELMVLAGCDLLACSVSSFSMLAAFLSDRPYLWFEPQLTQMGGAWTIWGDEEPQRRQGSLTRTALELRSEGVPARAIPVSASGSVDISPDSLVTPAGGWDRRRDLLYYGAVPMSDPERQATAAEGGSQ
jgi:hypothetical protein